MVSREWADVTWELCKVAGSFGIVDSALRKPRDGQLAQPNPVFYSGVPRSKLRLGGVFDVHSSQTERYLWK
jgi:hypothetical protein